jgi:putative ABC transport system ATP-binding protein
MSNPTRASKPAAIAISGLRFAYRQGGEAVLDLERFHLGPGESCFLYGPSGCGKTTLLGLIAGVLAAREGSVNVLGAEMSTMSGRRRDAWRGENLGYVFQMFNLIPYLTVRENITLPCRLHRARQARLGNETAEQAADRLANALDLSGLLGRGVLELSVGQQQRVAAARALIGAPPLVIADEPTSALDTAHRERFLELLLGQCRAAGSALLFVSHDQGLAALFDRQVSLPEINRAAKAVAA